METDLGRIKVALAVMSNAELDALIQATYKADQIAPGLLTCLDSAPVWQLQRRDGYHYELQPPVAAIPPEKDAVSIDAARYLRKGIAGFARAIRCADRAADRRGAASLDLPDPRFPLLGTTAVGQLQTVSAPSKLPKSGHPI